MPTTRKTRARKAAEGASKRALEDVGTSGARAKKAKLEENYIFVAAGKVAKDAGLEAAYPPREVRVISLVSNAMCI